MNVFFYYLLLIVPLISAFNWIMPIRRNRHHPQVLLEHRGNALRLIPVAHGDAHTSVRRIIAQHLANYNPEVPHGHRRRLVGGDTVLVGSKGFRYEPRGDAHWVLLADLQHWVQLAEAGKIAPGLIGPEITRVLQAVPNWPAFLIGELAFGEFPNREISLPVDSEPKAPEKPRRGGRAMAGLKAGEAHSAAGLHHAGEASMMHNAPGGAPSHKDIVVPSASASSSSSIPHPPAASSSIPHPPAAASSIPHPPAAASNIPHPPAAASNIPPPPPSSSGIPPPPPGGPGGPPPPPPPPGSAGSNVKALHPESFWAKEPDVDISNILGGADFSGWKEVVLPKKELSAEERAAKEAGKPQIVTNPKRAFALGIQMKALKGTPLNAQGILKGLTSRDQPFDEKTVNTLASFLPSDEKENTENANIAKVGAIEEARLAERLPDPVDRLVYVMASNPHFRYMIEVRRFKQGVDELAEVYRANFTKVRDLMATIRDSLPLKQMLRVAVHVLNQVQASNLKPNQPAPKPKLFITFKDLQTLSSQRNKLGSLLLAILKAIRPDHPIHRLPETLALTKAYVLPNELENFGNSLVTLNSKLKALDGKQADGDLDAIREAHFGHLLVGAKAALQEALDRRAEAEAIAQVVARLYNIPSKDHDNEMRFMLGHLAEFVEKMEQTEAVIAKEAAAAAARERAAAAKAKRGEAKPAAAGPAVKKPVEFLKRSGSRGSGDNLLRGSSFSLNPARKHTLTRVL
jgi:hypothetical protein